MLNRTKYTRLHLSRKRGLEKHQISTEGTSSTHEVFTILVPGSQYTVYTFIYTLEFWKLYIYTYMNVYIYICIHIFFHPPQRQKAMVEVLCNVYHWLHPSTQPEGQHHWEPQDVGFMVSTPRLVPCVEGSSSLSPNSRSEFLHAKN